jgi:para-aminobenzoate synthetase component 1
MALRASGALDDILTGLPSERDVAVVRDGAAYVMGLSPSAVLRASGPEALAALDALREGWWAGFIAYDLGRAIESVPERNPPDPLVSDLCLVRFDEQVRVEEEAAPRRDRARAPTHVFWRSSLNREAWVDAVERIGEHLRAGDCYQVNLTRRLHTPRRADPIALFRELVRDNPAPHAALVRIGDVAVVSASPERFLRLDRRRIQTRPIKGTSSDPAALLASAKDRAENVMIVDLARNDLGRICTYGSVRVEALCALEGHPGLCHLVSTVAGTLRADVGLGDVVRATFPPASVTGCPKPRVLEIIETLEPVRRGVYCGAVGFIDADAGVVDLNVAIRTFTITVDGTFFGVGGGIVADSEPGAEWEETELKARHLLSIARRAF